MRTILQAAADAAVSVTKEAVSVAGEVPTAAVEALTFKTPAVDMEAPVMAASSTGPCAALFASLCARARERLNGRRGVARDEVESGLAEDANEGLGGERQDAKAANAHSQCLHLGCRAQP